MAINTIRIDTTRIEGDILVVALTETRTPDQTERVIAAINELCARGWEFDEANHDWIEDERQRPEDGERCVVLKAEKLDHSTQIYDRIEVWINEDGQVRHEGDPEGWLDRAMREEWF